MLLVVSYFLYISNHSYIILIVAVMHMTHITLCWSYSTWAYLNLENSVRSYFLLVFYLLITCFAVMDDFMYLSTRNFPSKWYIRWSYVFVAICTSELWSFWTRSSYCPYMEYRCIELMVPSLFYSLFQHTFTLKRVMLFVLPGLWY
jgi:hypothetical protein